MSTVKTATPAHPVHELIAARWSPYAFDGRAVDATTLRSLLEAARWAASSYNEQPWRFVLAPREDATAFEKALDCLVPANREWAKHAGAIVLTLVSTQFRRNGEPNRCAEHDLGLAIGNLTLEATHRGLHLHQMAGIDADRIVTGYSVPEGFQPVTAVAIGYAARPESAGELGARDTAPRDRMPLNELVFGAAFGQALWP